MASKIIKPTEVSTNKLSHKIKPEKMTVVAWQFALRRQFGQGNIFEVKNLGTKPVYSDFDVYNAETDKHYKVAIRSQDNSLNFCTCNDFKTNGLNTCKHIEYVLHQIRNYAPYHKILLAGYQPDYSSIYLKYGAVREVKIKIGTQGKGKLEALAKKYFNVDDTLKDTAYSHINDLVQEAKQINNTFRIYDDAMEYIIERRETEQRKQILEATFVEGIHSNYFKNLTNTNLYDYQKIGAIFLAKAGRALLADDMGLGKSLQAIAACQIWHRLFDARKIWIVCPRSLVLFWKSEIETHTTSIAKIIEPNDVNAFSSLTSNKWLYAIVSYEMIADMPELLQSIEPDAIIIDEAHRIKNWPTDIAMPIKQIKSKYIIAISATPLDRQLEELYGVMQFIDIFKLGPRYQFMYNHQTLDKEGNVTGYKNLQHIKLMLTDVLLRRTLPEVLPQLPTIVEKNLLMPISKPQYEMQRVHHELLKKLVAKWQLAGKLGETDRQQLLIHLQQLRMICTNTFVADQQTNSGFKLQELLFILQKASVYLPQKIVIFSQWERMTRLVAKALHEHKYQFQYIETTTAKKAKEQLIQAFATSKANSILLCTDSGMEDLKVPQTSLLVNLDLPLTPDLLASRIATTNTNGGFIQIVNLISSHSIEQKLFEIYHKKSTSQNLLALGDNIIFASDFQFDLFMKTIERLVDWKEEWGYAMLENEQNNIATQKKNTGEASLQLSFFENIWDNTTPSHPTEIVKSKASKTIFPNTEPTSLEQSEGIISAQLLEKYMVKDDLSGAIFLKIPLTDIKTLDQISKAIMELKKMVKKR